MPRRIEDICASEAPALPLGTTPHAPPLYLSSVFRCEDPAQADALLAGKEAGFVYSRDGHPNAVMLAEKCQELHSAERAAIAATGMGALSAAVLAFLQQGDHVVVSNQLYGASLQLLTAEVGRLGIASTVVDTCDLAATRAAFTPKTKLVVVETITNPLLRVSDIAALAELSHEHGAKLLVDNSFASPTVCRPLELGADLVLESLTKIMNGHSDVVLGMLAGKAKDWDRVGWVLSKWGLASSPMDCWLALRGISTLALRAKAAGSNAQEAAEFLTKQKGVKVVHYPGLKAHPDHELAARQFGGSFGSMVTFTLVGGLSAAEKFIKAGRISFCPSLGELTTTLSHPSSTSHRGLTPAARAGLGIEDGTIRLSVGIESPAAVLEMLETSLAAIGN